MIHRAPTQRVTDRFFCFVYRGALVPWATVAKIHTKARLQALRASAGAAAPQAAAAAAAAPKGRMKVCVSQAPPLLLLLPRIVLLLLVGP